MTIERAVAEVVRKPWGSADLTPWGASDGGEPIGELWFQRAAAMPQPTLLFKLLFTTAPLSIQVHPDDAYARMVGLAGGKTEAWYILSARPEARVAVGLRRSLDAAQLRGAIEDGSIAGLVKWRSVRKGDSIFVPAGTIHAIGAGLVIAEIQQRSDTTYRLYDFGRERALHAEAAVAVARTAPAGAQPGPRRLTEARTLLVASPYFLLERIVVPPGSVWRIMADSETWIFVVEGGARIGSIEASVGDVVFLDEDSAGIDVGQHGLVCLLAYVRSAAAPDLLVSDQGAARPPARDPSHLPVHHQAAAGSSARPTEAPAWPTRPV